MAYSPAPPVLVLPFPKPRAQAERDSSSSEKIVPGTFENHRYFSLCNFRACPKPVPALNFRGVRGVKPVS